MNRKEFLTTLGVGAMGATFTLSGLERWVGQSKSSERMPVLFLGHGSPMNALEDNIFTRAFREQAASMPVPKAVLCISAHWYTKGTKLTAMDMPRTIHDFGGFPRELHEFQYPTPGSAELATSTQELLLPVEAELDHEWGLDHGAWSVLAHLFPEANIPTIQMSIDYTKPFSYHFELGQRLQKLRDKGILIVGSGNIIHNLRMLGKGTVVGNENGYDWAWTLREKINNHILEGNFDPLVHMNKMGKEMKLAVPTDEHYLPMIYTLGLKIKNDKTSLFNDMLIEGSLSMTSIRFGA